MLNHEYILYQPVFFLFIAFSFLLTAGYFWGRRQNRKIFLSAFDDLMKIVRPDDQNFTNIGGAIGYHANFLVKKKGSFLSRVDATITLLPRHSWLYLPVSKMTRRYDRLFITLYLKKPPREEAHLIEKKYNGFRGSKITNAENLTKEEVMWGKQSFILYYQGTQARKSLMTLINDNPDPGTVRHIALVPNQKKAFVFMIPKRDTVAHYFAPIYRWFPSVIEAVSG